MQTYEQLGSFYLGRSVDTENDHLTTEKVLYDAKDLTTHAVIIGMTGSGKTGLGIGLLEEAALDQVPVIAIDPKGDLGNLLLTFPDFLPERFAPWVNAAAAENKGLSVEDYAKQQAELWQSGLKDWDQDGARIARLKSSAEFGVYTPGSDAGLSLSLLDSLTCPPEEVRADQEGLLDLMQSTVTSLLTLLDIDADPITDREHILLTNIVQHFWQQGEDLSLPTLIHAIQKPPFEQLGVMDVNTVFAEKDRFKLAMQLNHLLASPGFAMWRQGDPLKAQSLLYTDAGKPKVSVVSIAHLNDAERMFVVTLILNQLITWMRQQPGTSSLRAILYMDEVFGFMPPLANPPAKQALLTLLKQARAYGLGVVLATQNPVDLDYKGLSNTGTWMIGRLQTERDKARVLEALEGVSQDAKWDRSTLDKTLSSLGKRRFLLHNVHESEPLVFNTRWAMSYLAGPMTRQHIQTLMAKQKEAAKKTSIEVADVDATAQQPMLPVGVKQWFVPSVAAEPHYRPLLLGVADVHYLSKQYDVDKQQRIGLACPFLDQAIAVDWDQASSLPLDANQLLEAAPKSARFAPLPSVANDAKAFTQWEKEWLAWLRSNRALSLFRCDALKCVSKPGETEGEFRIRLRQLEREQRDLDVAKLRELHATKAERLQERLRKAEQALEREQDQAKNQRWSTVLSMGAAVLGAVLGRKAVSKTDANKMSTAMKGLGRMRKESGDISRADENVEAVEQAVRDLEQTLVEDIARIRDQVRASDGELDAVAVQLNRTHIQTPLFGVVWIAHA